MIEAGVINLIVNMLESDNDDVRIVVVYFLDRMVEHGMVSYLCITVELTNCIQRTSELP
jgi:hypothetical protein